MGETTNRYKEFAGQLMAGRLGCEDSRLLSPVSSTLSLGGLGSLQSSEASWLGLALCLSGSQ